MAQQQLVYLDATTGGRFDCRFSFDYDDTDMMATSTTMVQSGVSDHRIRIGYTDGTVTERTYEGEGTWTEPTPFAFQLFWDAEGDGWSTANGVVSFGG
jgi:hypothetical protein